MSPTSYQAAPSRVMFVLYAALASLFRCRGFCFGCRLGAIHKLDQCHRRVVADAVSHLQDAGVATGTSLVTRAEFGEQLGDDVTVAQAVKGQAAVRQCRLFS